MDGGGQVAAHARYIRFRAVRAFANMFRLRRPPTARSVFPDVESDSGVDGNGDDASARAIEPIAPEVSAATVASPILAWAPLQDDDDEEPQGAAAGETAPPVTVIVVESESDREPSPGLPPLGPAGRPQNTRQRPCCVAYRRSSLDPTLRGGQRAFSPPAGARQRQRSLAHLMAVARPPSVRLAAAGGGVRPRSRGGGASRWEHRSLIGGTVALRGSGSGEVSPGGPAAAAGRGPWDHRGLAGSSSVIRFLPRWGSGRSMGRDASSSSGSRPTTRRASDGSGGSGTSGDESGDCGYGGGPPPTIIEWPAEAAEEAGRLEVVYARSVHCAGGVLDRQAASTREAFEQSSAGSVWFTRYERVPPLSLPRFSPSTT